MGAKSDFSQLFDDFKIDEFFSDAVYSFSWVLETVTSIDRTTGASIKNTNTYSADAFLLNPSKGERPSQKIFRDIQAGDIVVMVKQAELEVKPPINQVVTFNSEEYSCKEVVSDPVGVTWKFLLRQ